MAVNPPPAPGWPRVQGFKDEACNELARGNDLAANAWATLAVAESVMALSSDLCRAVAGVAVNLSDLTDSYQRVNQGSG